MGYLRAMDIFQDLGTSDMDWLERVTTMLTAQKGQVVYMPGETGEVLFLLKKGRVQIYRLSADGQKLVIGTLEPNTFFGEMSLLGQGMYDAFAETVEDATICAMSRRDVEDLVARKPQVALRILSVVGQRLIAAESLLEDLAFRSVSARLAALLLRLAEHRADSTVRLTHQELAEMAGTYRETATLYLNQFKAEGLIDLRRRQIAILNSTGLRRVAQS
ncbi:MAG: Crp/Fnr family transcriptional regulator [Chloroflexi bacterium]|nr:Crp/Fnr family transcriptional regulator [Chloroflexota bacterium]